jgi:hypothetical protein
MFEAHVKFSAPEPTHLRIIPSQLALEPAN